MAHEQRQIAATALAAILLSACSTVKMPNIDMPGVPEFKEAAAKLIEGFPDVSQAPVRPKDLRSAADWDAAAKTLMTERRAFDALEQQSAPDTPQDVINEIEQLKAQVRIYKLDDPQ